jgi:hypothetical protein
MIALLCAACSSDAVFQPVAPAAENLYWKLRLNEHAVQLTTSAPYNTMQLVATPRTYTDDEWVPGEGTDTTGGPTAYRSTDSSKVQVTQDGVVHAVAVTSAQVRVIASRQIGQLTHADTVVVRVVADPAPVMLGDITIAPTDSAKVGLGTNKSLPLKVTNKDGGTITGAIAYYTTADTTIAKFNNAWTATVTPRSIGSTLVTATIWVYGEVRTDTFTLSIGYPVKATFNMTGKTGADGRTTASLDVTTREVGPGATLSWVNATGDLIDVTFDDPSAALAPVPPGTNGSGNIVGLPGDAALTQATRTQSRRFLEPGTYTFHTSRFGLTGSVVVRDR